ncbi:phage tail length tape measure family protein [Thioclava sp.]|uniref:phage tail length tape measure family protein n=1 Tax=Thioclava sp. TaxID=1933450 RepID=UPI0032428E7F
MVDFARLVMTADATGMVAGHQALDAIAQKGATAERTVTKAMREVGASGKIAGRGLQDADAAAKRTAASMQAAAVQAGQVTNQTRAAAGQTANLTSQFNDIAVMMAAGQNPIQLALQQGTQITQVFTQLGGGASALRAVGGAVMAMVNPLSLATLGTIALGTAAVQWFTSMGGSAEKVEDRIEALTGSLKAYQAAQELANNATGEAAAQYGLAANSAQAYFDAQAGLSRMTLDQRIKSEAAALLEMVGAYHEAAGEISNVQAAADLFGRSNAVFGNAAKELRGQIIPMIEALQGYRDATDLQDRIDLLEQASLRIADLVRLDGRISTQEQEVLDSLNAQMQVLLPLRREEIDLGQERLTQAYEFYAATRRESDAMANAAADIIGKYDRQAAMSRTIAQYGADSAQVEALKRDEAMRAAQALLEQHNISGPLADQLVRSAMAAFDAATGADTAAASLRNAEAAARGLASAIAAAAGFTANLDGQIAVIETRIAAQKSGADAAIAGQVKSLELQAVAQRDASLAAGEAAHIAQWRYQQDMERIGQLGTLTAQEKALSEAARESGRAASSARKGIASEAKKAAREAEKLADNLDREAQQWRELLDPVAKYKREVSDLTKLSGLLSKGEMAEAQRRLNVELADSLPLAGEFVDTMTDGLLSGFNGTLSSMGDMLKKWLAQAIAMAAKNRIVIGMGLGGMGGVGGAASALGGVPGLGGAGGMLGGIGAGLGAFGGAALTGASGFLSAAAGGLGSAATYTGFMLKGATSGLVGLGSALGAIALPLAGVAAVFSFFSKKTKELDAGMRITVDGFETMVETFRKTETRRFWGLSKKTRTSYDGADRETQDALARAVGDLQEGVMNAAQVLGFGAETFAAFSHVMQISTKGMSEEEAMKAVQEAITGLGDDFAGMVPGLERLTKGGETASAALSRLSQSLVGVNGIMDTLGHKFKAAGLAGADAASQIADAFGGLDAMASATQRFYQAFYSEQERLETTTRQTGKALDDLGLAMPRTRNEYRAIIASMDLTTKKGRETYAALIGLADAFDVILPQVASLSAEMAALQGSVQTGLDAAISAAGEAATANARAAADWYKAAASIREYMDKLRGTASALFSPQQALRYNRGQYQATRMRAMAGDLSAAQDITGTADRYLSSVLATAKTREEAALAQARVLSDLGLLQGSGDIEGARHDVIAGLLGKQVEVMERYRDILVANGTLTAKQIEGLGKKLGGLDDAIAAAELINYQYLKEKLKVTVDVIADAKIPAHLKTLLANATNGVEGFVDFIARSDLPADMKWLALAKSSKHLKTVAYLAQNNLGLDYTRLALRAGSRYQVKVSSVVEKGGALDPDQLRKLLTGTASGRITLGGTFKFDPAAGFATWYESATRTAISTPMNVLREAMGTLRGSLLSLRAAILAEAKRQREAVEKAKETVNKPDPKPKPKPAPAKKYSAADYRGRTVITNNGFAQSDGDRLGREYGYSLTGPLGGTKVFGSQTEANAWLRANNYPAFAAGGTHRGGPAYVGEKDLELVAPSRIYNPSETRAMLDNRETVAELKALRAEIAELRAHARRTADSAVQTEKTLKRVDALGLKIDPDQNKVTT